MDEARHYADALEAKSRINCGLIQPIRKCCYQIVVAQGRKPFMQRLYRSQKSPARRRFGSVNRFRLSTKNPLAQKWK